MNAGQVMPKGNQAAQGCPSASRLLSSCQAGCNKPSEYGWVSQGQGQGMPRGEPVKHGGSNAKYWNTYEKPGRPKHGFPKKATSLRDFLRAVTPCCQVIVAWQLACCSIMPRSK